jgi:4-hydroxybenzoyl-CoA thioesterase
MRARALGDRDGRRPPYSVNVSRSVAAGVAGCRDTVHATHPRESARVKFTTHKMIQFFHCDPAGIVFYPQYFYILSESKEDFLMHIGHPMHRMINEQRRGWPMVRLETDFKRRSRYGDRIEVDIEVFKLGAASLGLQYTVRGDDGERLVAKSIIVLTDLDTGQPVPIPEDMRAALANYLIPA